MTSVRKSPREMLVITVSASEIVVDGRKIATVAEALAGEGDLIAPLKAELDLQANRQMLRKANESQSKAVTIMGDKDIPYRLLRKVMVTAARADYANVSFAVTPRATAALKAATSARRWS